MSTTIANINTLLGPVLFQVIGTTPESLVESVKKAGLEGRVEQGAQLASIAIFAAAVNKQVLGEFLMRPELAGARATVVSQFSIRNLANMTALTLLGHCLYLTRFAEQVDFAREFRKKMGQQSIWDGSLEQGSLSETQRKILQEKGKSINKISAGLFASGFFKFIGADNSRWSEDESRFWDVSITPTRSSPPKSVSSGSDRRPSTSSGTTKVTLSDGKEVIVSKKAYDYYMAINQNDKDRFESSVKRDGAKDWSARYEDIANKDPNMTGGTGAGTVVGN